MQSKVYDFAVIGGDLRQVYLKNALLSRNYTVCEYALCRESDGDTIDSCLLYTSPSPRD